ncbi:MAG: DNA replication and repair protein RecF [Saprospiraceae bacterium]|jgi:DNA replication and repair protein RecF
MFLKNISIVNFKNFEGLELSFNPKINCLVGDNGEGKTNLLDAIYYLTFCKSFLNPIDSQNVKTGESFLLTQGVFEKDSKNFHVHCGIKKGQKKVFKLNKKEYEKLADHIGEFPLVIISPTDRNLITEGSDLRRKFLDGILAQYDKLYLETLLQYNKVLAHRNALLKYFSKERTFSQEQLDVWDVQLVSLGYVILQKRIELTKGFIPVFQKYYQRISNSKEEVGLNYESQLIDDDFQELLNKSVQKDIQRQFSNVGIHKDDLSFTLKDNPVKKFASQGQQKTYLIALKLAQLEFLKDIKRQTPILLLDDIFDKLDEKRVGQLLELVNSNEFGQIFITDTDALRTERILKRINSEHAVFKVADGDVKIL